MLSGIEIFNFFVSDHLKVPYTRPCSDCQAIWAVWSLEKAHLQMFMGTRSSAGVSGSEKFPSILHKFTVVLSKNHTRFPGSMKDLEAGVYSVRVRG